MRTSTASLRRPVLSLLRPTRRATTLTKCFTSSASHPTLSKSQPTSQSQASPASSPSPSKPTNSPSTPLPFSSAPAPPRLPPKEQALYESLQASSTGAFSTPRVNQISSASSAAATTPIAEPSAHVQASGKGDELHPDVRRGAKPEFEGEVNPKTGEVGGPKVEPLRWGDKGDWSYNGRVTDF